MSRRTQFFPAEDGIERLAKITSVKTARLGTILRALVYVWLGLEPQIGAFFAGKRCSAVCFKETFDEAGHSAGPLIDTGVSIRP